MGQNEAQFQTTLNLVRAHAGFRRLIAMDFNEAHILLVGSKVDPREIISLWPRMLPRSSNFTRCAPPLHDVADINQICRGDREKLQKFETFLVKYLESVAQDSDASTVLIKLYATIHPERLGDFITAKPVVDMDDAVAALESGGHHHFLALLYHNQNFDELAYGVWSSLLTGTLEDSFFPGIDFVVEKLVTADDQFKWKYADRILKSDQMKGVKIFINSFEKSDSAKLDKIADYLEQYTQAYLAFLEFMVAEKEMKVIKLMNRDNLGFT